MNDWLVAQIRQHGPGKVVWAPVVALSVSAGIVGGFGWTAGAFIFIGLLALGAFVVALASIDQLQRAVDDGDQLRRALGTLRAYIVDKLQEQAGSTTVLWRDEIIVNKKGDVHWLGRLTVRAEGPNALHFVETKLGGEPLTPAERRRMSITVPQGEEGARLPIEVEWESDRSARVWTHFGSALQPGQEITLVMEHSWPHTLAKLGTGGVEHMTWTPDRPTERFEYTILLLPELKRRTALGSNVDGFTTPPAQRAEGGGWRVEGEAENLTTASRLNLSLDAG